MAIDFTKYRGITVERRKRLTHWLIPAVLDRYGLSRIVAEEYIEQLCIHFSQVEIVGAMLGLSPGQRHNHDNSKLDTLEFPIFAQNTGDDRRYEALSHHYRFNAHHWQNRVVVIGRDEIKVLPMTRNAVLEMVCDWMAVSKVKTDSYRIDDWLAENLPAMFLHPDSVIMLKTILGLVDVAYTKIIDSFYEEARGQYDPLAR